LKTGSNFSFDHLFTESTAATKLRYSWRSTFYREPGCPVKGGAPQTAEFGCEGLMT